MPFKPFDFTYNPPATVASPSTVPDPVTPDSVTPFGVTPDSAAVLPASTNSAKATQQLADLAKTSAYLQAAILSQYRNTTVTFPAQGNPEVAAALARIYQTENPPEQVSIPMYGHMLDAELAAVELDMLSKGSNAAPNPIQVADLSLVTSQVENALIESGSWQNQVPLALRSLKGDEFVFSQWQAALNDYPAVRVEQSIANGLNTPGPIDQAMIAASNIDLSDSLYGFMNDYSRRMAGVYSGLYSYMTEMSQIQTGAVEVINVFALQPLAEIASIIGLLKGTKGLFHKEALHGLFDGLQLFVLDRLRAEAGGMLTVLDRMNRMAVDPLRNATGQLRLIMLQSQRMKAQVGVSVGGLKGISAADPCATAGHPKPKKGTLKSNIAKQQSTNPLSDALLSLGNTLDWAANLGAGTHKFVDEQFRKLAERKLKGHRDHLQILCNLRCLDQLIGLAMGLITETRQGTNLQTASPAQRVDAVNRIAANLQTGPTTSLTIQDGTVTVPPANMPTTTVEVQRVLTRGGLDLITSDSVQKIQLTRTTENASQETATQA